MHPAALVGDCRLQPRQPTLMQAGEVAPPEDLVSAVTQAEAGHLTQALGRTRWWYTALWTTWWP
jgi:hypothetical protein